MEEEDSSELTKNFGARVRALRKEKGLSQEALALYSDRKSVCRERV